MQKELVQTIETAINLEVAKRPVGAVDILPREAFQIPDLIRTKINLLPDGILKVRVVEIGASTCKQTEAPMLKTPLKLVGYAWWTIKAKGKSINVSM
jgi:hypothetical protein